MGGPTEQSDADSQEPDDMDVSADPCMMTLGGWVGIAYLAGRVCVCIGALSCTIHTGYIYTFDVSYRVRLRSRTCRRIMLPIPIAIS